MKVFKKRIGFLISSQHLIPHGGIGQFAKGFVEMAGRLDWVVDIIMDAPPLPGASEFVGYLKSIPNVNFKSLVPPSNDFVAHQKIHSFSESLNFEKVMKFRDSLMKAMQSSLYDALVINTPEALFSTYALGIQDYIKIVFYTHNENLVFRNNTFKGVFNDNYDPMIESFMRLPGIFVGTQSSRNNAELKEAGLTRTAWLPMPIPERSLLDSSDGLKKEGCLFIGRWEERKNPKAFVKAIKDSGLMAKVMTNENGAKKFEEEFKKEGIENFVIKKSIIGEDKVNFIKSAKVFYMPSKSESFGFALMEALCHCHCVVEDYDWVYNFKTDLLSIERVGSSKVGLRLRNLHYSEEGTEKGIKYVRSLDSASDLMWRDFIEQPHGLTSNSSSAKINEQDDFFVDAFIDKTLGRFASTEDLISIYGNRKKFNNFQTLTRTFLTKSEEMVVKEEEDNLDAFFG